MLENLQFLVAVLFTYHIICTYCSEQYYSSCFHVIVHNHTVISKTELPVVDIKTNYSKSSRYTF